MNGMDLSSADLILRLRVNTAQSNLDSFGTVLAAVKGYREAMKLLRESLGSKRAQAELGMADLSTSLGYLAERLKSDQLSRSMVVACQEQLASVRKTIEQARNVVDHLADPYEQVNDDRLEERRRKLEEDIDEFQKKIREATDKLRFESRESRDEIWNILSEIDRIRPLWGQFVDYLSGLCLRHNRLDRGICEIADGLIAEYGRSMSAVAIPGREGAIGTFLARIVYLHYPAWTIWALPALARELWYLIYNKEHTFKYLEGWLKEALPARKIAEEDPVTQDCLADIFGTISMGVSYACTTILLSLDPRVGSSRSRADAILQTLRYIDIDNNRLTPYGALIPRLERQWQDACQSVRKVAFDKVFPAPLIAFMGKYFEEKGTLYFPVRVAPEQRKMWVQQLAQQSGTFDVSGEVLIRHAIEAAWRARIEHPASTDLIELRAEELCRGMMERNKRQLFTHSALAENARA